jgi:hypothetical protein
MVAILDIDVYEAGASSADLTEVSGKKRAGDSRSLNGFRNYGQEGATLVILLARGTKRSQARDIDDAKDRWKDYKARKRRGC